MVLQADDNGVGDRPIGKLRPYQHGALDGLCGIYAAINAMRLAIRAEDVKEAFWEELFASFVLGIESRVGVADALLNGIGAKPLFAILQEVAAESGYRWGRKFIISQPFRQFPNPSTDCLREHLAWLSAQPGAAVIVKLKRPHHHWT